VIKAFLMEVTSTRTPGEAMRNPTWFSADEARKVLAKGREVKYAAELDAVIDRALERIQPAMFDGSTRADSRSNRYPARY